MIVDLNTAKSYLRVDGFEEDTLITGFLQDAEKRCRDTLRAQDGAVIDSPIVKVSILAAVAYLYEHRENADMKVLSEMLRYSLSTEREAKF